MLLKSRYYIPEPEVAPKVYTPDLDGLISWLADQPSETIYDWGDYHDCLMCRYMGVKSLSKAWFESGLSSNDVDKVVYPRPWTYASALLRARNLRDGVA